MNHVFFVIVTLSIVSSVAATIYVVKTKGIAYETNPIVSWLYVRIGAAGIIVPRLIPIGLSFVAAYVVLPKWPWYYVFALLPYLAVEVYIAQNDVRFAMKVYKEK